MNKEKNLEPAVIEILNLHHSKVNFFLKVWRLILSPKKIINILNKRMLAIKNDIQWDSRAEELGEYSVIDNRHSREEFDYVTAMQKKIIYPYLKNSLNGQEKSLLDFGCGVGRFTADLANIINGRAVGFDPTKKLIDLCRADKNVEFISAQNYLEESSECFDVIWICLVLGGISTEKLIDIAKKIINKLNKDGLLILIESTGNGEVEAPWRVRSIEDYEALFQDVNLSKIGKYYDAGQEISIFSGRKSLYF